jgi:predicted DNA-binding transcriptional regulator AlpA
VSERLAELEAENARLREQLNGPERLLRFLGLAMGTVLDHFEKGEIPGFRLYGRKGGPVRFRLSEIEEWLERCRVGAHEVGSEVRDGG